MSGDDPIPGQPPQERTYERVLAEAVRALTDAARLTRPVLAWDEAASAAAGHQVWVVTDRHEQADWAEFVTLALAGATANIGSIDAALAGRSGSWEADGVRNLLSSTVGHDEASLLEHRTDPVVVDLYVDVILADLGLWTAYDQAASELGARYDAISTTDPDEFDRQADAITELEQQLEQQRVADLTAYGQALAAAAAVAADEQLAGLPVPVTVTVDLTSYAVPDWPAYDEYGPVGRLRQTAIERTPLPGGGRTPLERLQATPPPAG